jgi:hypothetical protein
VRQDPLELDQGPGTGLLHPGDPACRSETDGDRHGFLVVQQQGRELGADAEPVVPARTSNRLHRIVQLTQPVDVVADGAGADLEPPG